MLHAISAKPIVGSFGRPETVQRLPAVPKTGKPDRSGVVAGPVLVGGMSCGRGEGTARNGSPLSSCPAFSHCPGTEESSLESSRPLRAKTHSTLGTSSASRMKDSAKEVGRVPGALLGNLFFPVRELRDVLVDVKLLAGVADLGDSSEKGSRRTFGLRAMCIGECSSVGTDDASVTCSSMRRGMATRLG